MSRLFDRFEGNEWRSSDVGEGPISTNQIKQNNACERSLVFWTKMEVFYPAVGDRQEFLSSEQLSIENPDLRQQSVGDADVKLRAIDCSS